VVWAASEQFYADCAAGDKLQLILVSHEAEALSVRHDVKVAITLIAVDATVGNDAEFTVYHPYVIA